MSYYNKLAYAFVNIDLPKKLYIYTIIYIQDKPDSNTYINIHSYTRVIAQSNIISKKHHNRDKVYGM